MKCNHINNLLVFVVLSTGIVGCGSPVTNKKAKFVEVGIGYSSTSVNCAVFRNSSLTTHRDTQFIAYYDPDGFVTLGKRHLNDTVWELNRTQYRGNVADAHNVISIGVDGDGYIHASFDHHGTPLRYARSLDSGSLELGSLEAMTGLDEDDVTYPEFYELAGGDLLFAYRSGASGHGNLIMNRYDNKAKKWIRIQDCLIDGEDERNAYWQLCTGQDGALHLSWVWRETWMVETNHDICYARSRDGGMTWEKSDGSAQELPITAKNAEYAWRVPQGSELINQTSMAADAVGNPYIATYWRDADSEVPQYRLVWNDGHKWKTSVIGKRTSSFSLAGGGTKMIPIARPRLVTGGTKAYYIFRDEERESRVSLASTDEINGGEWTITDLTEFSVGAWEPTIDTSLWNRSNRLHVFVQAVKQGDGERSVANEPTPVYVLELN